QHVSVWSYLHGSGSWACASGTGGHTRHHDGGDTPCGHCGCPMLNECSLCIGSGLGTRMGDTTSQRNWLWWPMLMRKTVYAAISGQAWAAERFRASSFPVNPARLPETYDRDDQDAWLLLVPPPDANAPLRLYCARSIAG